MVIDPAYIGTTFPPFTYTIERSHICALVTAIGHSDPIYCDRTVATRAGYPDIPAPPTLPAIFSTLGNPSSWEHLRVFEIYPEHMLHIEQEYRYYTPMYSGDTLTGLTRIVDIKNKRRNNNTISLLTLETTYTNQRSELTVVDRMTLSVRKS